jgi:hypothetical protein
MSSELAKRAELPPLPVQWRGVDAAAEHEARAEGARLAKRGADLSAEMDSFRRKLATAASADLTRLGETCATQLKDALDKRERLKNELDRELPGRARENQQANADTLAQLRRLHGPDSPAHKDAAAKAEDAAKDLRKAKAEVDGRPLRTHLGIWYIFAMVGLALAEVPVNRSAFELAFREEPLFSLLLAGAVGGVLIFFAHLIGILLRQWPLKLSVVQIGVRIGALALLLSLTGAGVYFLARMRQAYLISTENEGFGQRLQEALQGSAAQAVVVVQDAPLGVNDWAFIGFNVLLFTFGVAASFMRHDPHPDYEKAIKRSQKADKRLARIVAEYEKKIAFENERFEARKRGFEAQMSDLAAAIAALSDQEAALRRHLTSSRTLTAQVIRSRCGAFADGFNAGTPPGGRRMVVPELRAIQEDLIVEGLPHAA